MASGVINGSTNNQYIDCKIEWSSVADVANNKSTVTATLYYKRNNAGYTTYGSGEFYVGINVGEGGVFYGGKKDLTITENAWVKAASGTATVTHNDDGRKSVKIKAIGWMSGTSLDSTNCEGTVTLDTISRASSISSVANITLGDSCCVKWTPLSASFKYKVELSLGNFAWEHKSPLLSPGNTAEYTYEEAIPFTVAECFGANSKSETVMVKLLTYTSAGSQIGGASTKTFTVTMPDNEFTQPTVRMDLSPADNTLPSPFNSLYIQGLSKVKATLGFGTKFGATIVASNITLNGKSYASPYESDILYQAGTVNIKATAKDSRGFYGTYYQDIEVIPYSKPYVRAKSGENSIIVARCDQSERLTDSGTYLKIRAKIVYSKVIFEERQNNYGFIKFRYRKEGEAYPKDWTTILDCQKDNSDEVITGPLIGKLETTSNYQVQIIASDGLYESAPITFAVPSDAVYMDRPAGGKSMGLGGYSSGDGILDVYWKIKARGGISIVDDGGNETDIASLVTMPVPRDKVKAGYDPNNLENGVYVVADSLALKSGDNVIMYNGILIQMGGTVSGNVKFQLALPADTNGSPMYRLCWDSNWADWRSLKL